MVMNAMTAFLMLIISSVGMAETSNTFHIDPTSLDKHIKSNKDAIYAITNNQSFEDIDVSTFKSPVNSSYLEQAAKALGVSDDVVNRISSADEGSKQEDGEKVYFLVSQSIPSSKMDQIIDVAIQEKASLVVIGVQRGQTMKSFRSLFSEYFVDRKKIPEVILNPRLFDQYSVTQVPTTIIEHDGVLALKAEGSVNVSYLKKRQKMGQKNIGVQGTTYPIAETHMVTLMKERYVGYDWDKAKSDADKRYWDRQEFVDLPQAIENRKREIDLSFVVTQDIKTSEGKILAAHGEIINPLSKHQFRKIYIAFDSTSDKQTSWALERVRVLRKSGQAFILMTSRFDRSRGWKHVGELNELFKQRVYKLQKNVRDQFQLEYLPSEISPGSVYMNVEEFALEG